MAESTPRVYAGFDWRDTAAGRVLVAAAIDPTAWHLFSTREVSPPGVPEPDYVAVALTLGVDDGHLVRVRQTHGRGVLVVRVGQPMDPRAEADAIVSFDPARAVLVRVADCVPILLADRHRRVVAAVHAGWRGTSAGVVAAAVDAIAAAGVPSSDLVAAIGPSIGPCCYQVDHVVRDDFDRRHAAAGDWFRPDGDGTWRLDLGRANRAQLEAAGVPSSAIVQASACTADGTEHWYSHRREGAAAGRMVAAIRLRA
jgi:polyphenol oxidase